MKPRFALAAPFAALLLIISSVAAPQARAGDAPLSTDQKAAIEKLIHDYLMAHPEVVLESVRKYRSDREQQAHATAQKNLSKLKAQLVDDPHTPVGGNPNGDVTIVEFFDYQCGYCKRAQPGLQAAIKKDGHVRIVYKEFPILGDASVYASHAALAAWLIDRAHYEAFHNAMMAHRGQMTAAVVWSLAAKAGLDVAEVKAKMNNPMVKQMIDANMRLAEQLNINGTPAFVIGGTLIPGYIEGDRIEALIRKARES